MIRVNLLETTSTPAPSLERGSTAGWRVGAGSPGARLLVVLCLWAVGNGGYWWHLQREQRTLAAALQGAQMTNRQLAVVKASYLERQREAESLRERVQVIEQLRGQQSGPAQLLRALGDTVNRTEAVWLSSLKDQGGSVALEGLALGTDAVANLMMNLKKSGYFGNIEIKETFQDETYKEAQAFQFVLTCDKVKG